VEHQPRWGTAAPSSRAAELSRAAGVHYTDIHDDGTFCDISATSVTDTFSYSVEKEGPPLHTWAQEIVGIKRDDGSATSVSGIGDHKPSRVPVKEFAAKSNGYIVFVLNDDVYNPATSARTKKIAQLLVSKL
jgi:hypothetical protein